MNTLLSLKKRIVQTFIWLGYSIIPPSCVICRLPSKRNFDLCVDCENDLPWIHSACQQCGIALNTKTPFCGNCIKTQPFFDNTISLFNYVTPIDKLVTQLKFSRKLCNASILGALMAKKLKQHYASRELPELIIPVPLHRKRLRQRGFNQAIELAKPVAKQLGLNIDRKLCKRIKNTPAQISLRAKQRKRNVRNAFQIKTLNVDYIAIIDDVMTTTSTVNELSKCLRQQGVKKIDVWVIARPE
jgi:ComF family protein